MCRFTKFQKVVPISLQTKPVKSDLKFTKPIDKPIYQTGEQVQEDEGLGDNWICKESWCYRTTWCMAPPNPNEEGKKKKKKVTKGTSQVDRQPYTTLNPLALRSQNIHKKNKNKSLEMWERSDRASILP